MTPERVSQWNAYYDVYVKWAALILVFMVACNYVTDSHVWLHLKTGQLIAKQSAPVTTDVFSYTEAGRPWFNIPWLFQWCSRASVRLRFTAWCRWTRSTRRRTGPRPSRLRLARWWSSMRSFGS